MAYEFDVQNGELCIRFAGDGTVLYRGRPDGKPVEKLVNSYPSGRAIVLLDYMAFPSGRPAYNLLCCGPDGSVVWRAPLPELGPDAYVYAEIREGRLICFTWSCYELVIDQETGEIVQSTFTK